MLLTGLLFGALQFDSVQTYFAKRLTAYLSSELNTKVSIDKVSIRLIKSVVLKGVYIQDLHGDTLLYAEDLDISIKDISTKKHFLEISKLTLTHAEFHLRHYMGDEHDNLFFLTNYFSSGDTTKSGSPWLIKVRNVSLREMQFTHNVDADTAVIKGVNFSHLAVTDVNGDFKDLSTVNDSIFLNISALRFREKSGFRVMQFAADAKIASDEIRLKKLRIITPNTILATDLTFNMKDFGSFDEFTKEVKWQSDFKNTTVSFTDIAYFAPELWGIDKALKIEGNFKGSVNNFKGRNVFLGWGSGSYFKGSISMNGLPYIANTYMDVNAGEIRTNKQDIEWVPVPPFEQKQHIVIPENLNPLGTIKFKGKFTGFVNDFVAYGNVSTGVGSLSSDLNFKLDTASKQSVYSGHISANQFDVGQIILVPELGKVTFSADVKGKGLKLDKLDARLNGGFSQLEFKNYTYQNIKVNGEVAKKLFNGVVSIKDPNADLDFRGSIDFRNKLPEFHFLADVRSVRLDTLNIYRTTEKTVVKASMRTQFAGNSLDNIVGGIEVDDIDFQTGNKLFHINGISIKADKSANERQIEIRSDNLDAHFNGQFELAKLGDSFKEILPRYLPSVILPRKSFTSNQDFEYNIRLKNLNVFAETFFPSWSFAPNTIITGHFNSSKNDLLIDLSTPWIKFKKFTFDTLSIRMTSLGDRLDIDAWAQRILQNEKNFIIRPDITASAENNRVNYTVNLADVDSLSNKGYLKGRVDFSSASVYDLRVDSSNITVEREHWDVSKENLIHFDSSAVTFSGLTFSKGVQSLSLNGTLGKKQDDRLSLSMGTFGLKNLNSFLFANATLLNGFVSGNVSVKDPFGKFQIETDLKVKDFSLNNDTLGNASLICMYDNEQKIINADISVIKGTAKVIDIKGTYKTDRKEDNLDFDVKLNNLYMHPLERYVTGVMKELYGKVSSDIKLTGTFAKPMLNGMVDLKKVSLVVDYLNTHYSFSSTVVVKDNVFFINGLKIVDVNNNTAVANGRITHDYFKNFRFDVELQAEKFQALNTTFKDNTLYYGRANATGYAHFYGPIHSMNMDITMAPEKGTTLNIPLSTSEDLTASSFITFINRSKDSSRVLTGGRVDMTGVNMNLNLEMNRNAEVNLIFDEKIGDIISGTGTGSLRLEITPSGSFNMYGAYTIENGDYLFTLKNLINKKFKIDNGGTITWSGDPYNAIIDLTAVYVVYTSTLYNVLPAASADESLKSRLPVDLIIHLTNKLMNPTINYEINVRELKGAEAGMLKTILNSEQEINRQMLGLLVFNQFVPYSGGGQTSATSVGAANASELLSNQVSNWLGQISTDVTIGVNYRAADTYSKEEVKILVSKSFINDRLTVEGDVGMVGGDPTSAKASNTVVGDFYANYKLGKDGRFSLKGFNRSNANNIINYSESPYTQGFGFMYRQEFNTIADLMVKWRLKKKTDVAEPKVNN